MKLEKKKFKVGEPLIVRWLDACFHLDENMEDFAKWIKNGGEVAQTIGFVYHIDKKGVLLCGEQFQTADHRQFTYIPAGMIYEIYRVKRENANL